MASFSSYPPSAVPLPPSVASLIQTICEEQSQPPPSAPARRELAALGEEQSRVLLGSIRSTRIKQTFDGFILYLARKHRSSSSSPAPPSPNVYSDNRPSPTACTTNLSSPATPGGASSLSGRVEELIARICQEQSQPPLGVHARRELEVMGEHEALKLLDYIRGRTITKSFDGFVMFMSNNSNNSLAASPSPARTVESVSSSPSYPAASSSGTSNGTSFTGVDEITSAFRENFTVSTPRSGHNLNVKMPESHHLQALQRLEYRKAFLILSYIGRNRLEDVLPVRELENLQRISSMVEFEDQAWNAFGKLYCDKRDRVKYLEWVSGKRYYYHCYVNSDGSYFFKGPHLNKVATHLQKVLGDDNVLIVKFCDAEANVLRREVCSNAGLTKFVEEGIFVGLRRFRYFVFKDGGKEKGSGGGVKCFFVNVDAFSHFHKGRAVSLDMKSMHAARCLFMHVHNVSSLSSYMARFSLIVSKTITLDVNLDAQDVIIEDIDDIPCKNDDGSYVYDKDGKLLVHTDGTGFISEELALRCPQNCHQGSALQLHFEAVQLGHMSSQLSLSKSKQDHVEPPLLIQFRMFDNGRAVKGTVLVNKKLQGKKIQIRPSMIKVKSDPEPCDAPIVSSFEIVSTSNRPKKPRLSRFLIALLSYGGVPDTFFSGLLKQSFDEARDVSSNIRAALRVALNHGDLDDNYTVARMILSGIPLHEAYIQRRLPILANEEKKSLKEGRLPISDSFYVMGTTDPTDSLCSDEVCIIHENGQISGDVLVYRHPGIHFGDIHALRATYIKGLEEVVGNSKYGIFFPTKGPRSLADKMAGGDYDGDMYWVSRNPQLLKNFKPSPPWIPTYFSPPAPSNKKPSEFLAEELERKLFDLFLTTRFQPSPSMSQAAHGWLAYMDRLLSLGHDRVDERHDLEEKMLRLVDLYSEALDAPKKGRKVVVPPDLIPKRYPHFMGRGETFSYKSESIMGYIFDKVDELQLEKPAVVVSKLPCLNIWIPLRCHVSWQDNYKAYRSEMAEALRSGDESKKDSARDVIQKYKQILYEADELDESPRAWEEIRFDALAIYHTTYEYAIQQRQASYCGFAWKVAGSALLRIFVEEQPEKPITCLPSVLKEVFG